VNEKEEDTESLRGRRGSWSVINIPAGNLQSSRLLCAKTFLASGSQPTSNLQANLGKDVAR
jgi:hypothetical protein